jgi:hypothetical protein
MTFVSPPPAPFADQARSATIRPLVRFLGSSSSATQGGIWTQFCGQRLVTNFNQLQCQLALCFTFVGAASILQTPQCFIRAASVARQQTAAVARARQAPSAIAKPLSINLLVKSISLTVTVTWIAPARNLARHARCRSSGGCHARALLHVEIA